MHAYLSVNYYFLIAMINLLENRATGSNGDDLAASTAEKIKIACSGLIQ